MANRYMYLGFDPSLLTSSVGTFDTNTGGGTFNPDYCDRSLWIDANSAYSCTARFFDGDAAVMGETFECLFHVYLTRWNGSNFENFAWRDRAGNSWLRLWSASGGSEVHLQYNAGSASTPSWVSLGDPFVIAEDKRHAINLKLTLGSPHQVQFFIDQALIVNAEFTQGALDEIGMLYLRQFTVSGSSSQTAYSECACSVGINLLGAHVFLKGATANGTTSQWVGDVTDIDDPTVSDTDYISATDPDLVSTFAFPDLPVLDENQRMGDVFTFVRARNNGTTPNGVLPVRRDTSGTNNVGTALNISVGFETKITQYSGLSPSEFDGSEFGVKSAA